MRLVSGPSTPVGRARHLFVVIGTHNKRREVDRPGLSPSCEWRRDLSNTVFAEQYDIVCIVVLQVAGDIASATAFQMVLEHFNR